MGRGETARRAAKPPLPARRGEGWGEGYGFALAPRAGKERSESEPLTLTLSPFHGEREKAATTRKPQCPPPLSIAFNPAISLFAASWPSANSMRVLSW